MKNPLRMTAQIISVFVILLEYTGAAAINGSDTTRSVANGNTWVVEEATHLSRLTIAEGAAVKATAGHNLTLTVDGTETPIQSGVFQGDVVLTPTTDISQKFDNEDTRVHDTYHYRAALYIDNGARIADRSVEAAVKGGEVDNRHARNIAITSKGDNFNGIIVTGNSTYTVENAKLDFRGDGGNDFAGFGAAIKSTGDARLNISHSTIMTQGVIRTALHVGGNSVMHVDHSYIEAKNGTLPPDFEDGLITGRGGVMKQSPWMLGVVGNVRATNLVENGTLYITDSHVRSQGWGALSTDNTSNVRLYATRTLIETIDSGYGAYAEGVGALDTFDACTFNVADYGLVMTDGSGVFKNKTVVNSRRFGVMVHSDGHGTLMIGSGTEFKTHEAVIQVKSAFPKIVVDNAKLSSERGVILEAIMNDDALAASQEYSNPVSVSAGSKPIQATFKHVNLKGDIINSMTALAGMSVTFENATIEGGISTATATHAHGEPSAQNYRLVGDMKHQFGRTAGSNGLDLSLGRNTRWVVNKTSYLTGLTVTKGAQIVAPRGDRVTLTVDGQSKPLTAGSSYTGAIVLTVSGI